MKERSIMSAGLKLLGVYALVLATHRSAQSLRTAFLYVKLIFDGHLVLTIALASLVMTLILVFAMGVGLVLTSRRLVTSLSCEEDTSPGKSAVPTETWYVWGVVLVVGFAWITWGVNLLVGFFCGIVAGIVHVFRQGLDLDWIVPLIIDKVTSLACLAALLLPLIGARRVGIWLHERKTRQAPPEQQPGWQSLLAACLGLLLALQIAVWQQVTWLVYRPQILLVPVLMFLALQAYMVWRLVTRRGQPDESTASPQSSKSVQDRGACASHADAQAQQRPLTERNIMAAGMRLLGIYALAIALSVSLEPLLVAFRFVARDSQDWLATNTTSPLGEFALLALPVLALGIVGCVLFYGASKLACVMPTDEVRDSGISEPPGIDWYIRACRLLGATLLILWLCAGIPPALDNLRIVNVIPLGQYDRMDNMTVRDTMLVLATAVNMLIGLIPLLFAGTIGRWLYGRKESGRTTDPLAGWYDLMAGLLGVYVAVRLVGWGVVAFGLDFAIAYEADHRVLLLLLGCVSIQAWAAWRLMGKPSRSAAVHWLPDGEKVLTQADPPSPPVNAAD